MHIKLLISLCFIIGLGACSARKLDVEDFDTVVDDKFVTAIKGDGIKLFTYSIKYAELPTMEQPHQQRIDDLKRMQRQNGGKRRSMKSIDLSQWTQQVELGLNKTIAMTQFCREGYIELSRIIEVGRGEIRGECNDGASDDDIAKFTR
ncbi:hypothetical protein [Shewanella sp. Isolate11]|uniref:hypothetical protein n=1 Tax=Shewanella sp. Isolate11 TaxID=2908530 RepID=UPI001EFE9CBA|nr:hypothetical protein [Shewanella sp. Isolate11]MCG9697069.1 hypothetical protein [Shewanella sp. Isolate11]